MSWVEQHRWLSSDRDLCSSIAAGMADISSPSGPCTGWDDRSNALCCLLEVIPHPNTPAYDEETFQAIVRHANRAFLNFASALSKFQFTNEGDNDSDDPVLRAVLQVCLGLERFEMEYWKVAGFPHPQFTKAVHDYFCIWERRQSTERFVDIIWASQIEGVRKLINAYLCGEDRQQDAAHDGPSVIPGHEDGNWPSYFPSDMEPVTGEGPCQPQAATISESNPLPSVTLTADGHGLSRA